MASVAVLVSSEPERALGFALRWAQSGDEVSVVLLDDAAAAARPGHPAAGLLRSLVDAGASVAVHDDALRRRGLDAAVVALKVVDLDEVADLVAEGMDKAVWW